MGNRPSGADRSRPPPVGWRSADRQENGTTAIDGRYSLAHLGGRMMSMAPIQTRIRRVLAQATLAGVVAAAVVGMQPAIRAQSAQSTVHWVGTWATAPEARVQDTL